MSSDANNESCMIVATAKYDSHANLTVNISVDV